MDRLNLHLHLSDRAWPPAVVARRRPLQYIHQSEDFPYALLPSARQSPVVEAVGLLVEEGVVVVVWAGVAEEVWGAEVKLVR